VNFSSGKFGNAASSPPAFAILQLKADDHGHSKRHVRQ
jgi:hypothetical protein